MEGARGQGGPRTELSVGRKKARLSQNRLLYGDTSQDLFHHFVSERKKIRINAKLYLLSILAFDHSGETVQRDRSGDGFGEHHSTEPDATWKDGTLGS